MNRRTILAGAAALAALPAPAVARTSSGYSTLVLAPHQDDETIRLSAYIAFAADRGDDVSLLTATDGGATKVGGQLGLTRSKLTRWRNREQDAAWAWLTDGRGGQIHRAGLPDGGATRKAVRDALAARLSAMPGTPEVYVASWHHDKAGHYLGDEHPDHVACIMAARDMAADGVTVRYARHPTTTGRGANYSPTDEQMLRIEGAVSAYTVIGHRSVAYQLNSVLSNPTTTVTR